MQPKFTMKAQEHSLSVGSLIKIPNLQAVWILHSSKRLLQGLPGWQKECNL